MHWVHVDSEVQAVQPLGQTSHSVPLRKKVDRHVLHGAPAVACPKPVLHVHAPVPAMPWLQTPPMPHEHGWHVAPK